MIPFVLPSPLNQQSPIWVIAGQSNAVGWLTGSPDSGPLLSEIPNCFIWSPGDSEFQLLEFGVNNLGNDSNANFGVELNLGYLSSSFFLQPTYIIKLAFGSSYLATQAGSDDWNASSSEYCLDLFDLISTALSSIDSRNIKGIIWIQGESDGLSSATANVYEDNLSAFVNYFRTNFLFPVPFLFVKPSSLTSPTYPYIDTIRSAMDAVHSAMPLTFTFDCDGASFAAPAPHVHYTSAYTNFIAKNCFRLLYSN